jgi:hypothetical protein
MSARVCVFVCVRACLQRHASRQQHTARGWRHQPCLRQPQVHAGRGRQRACLAARARAAARVARRKRRRQRANRCLHRPQSCFARGRGRRHVLEELHVARARKKPRRPAAAACRPRPTAHQRQGERRGRGEGGRGVGGRGEGGRRDRRRAMGVRVEMRNLEPPGGETSVVRHAQQPRAVRAPMSRPRPIKNKA